MLVASWALGAVTSTKVALAEDPSPSADELFRAGRRASEAGQHREACQLYQRSMEIEESRGTRLNLALCQIELGQLVEATASLNRVAAQLGPADERQTLVAQRLQNLESRTPRVILLANLPPDAEIRYDGTLLTRQTLDRPLRVNPGRHEFLVSSPRTTPNRVSLEFREGEQRIVTLQSGAQLPGDPIAPRRVAAPPPPVEPATSNRVVAYGALGLSGVGVGVVAVGSALMVREAGIVASNCTGGACEAAGLEAGARGRTLVVITSIAGGVALLSGGVGLYLLRADNKPARAPRLGVMTDSRGAYVNVSSRW